MADLNSLYPAAQAPMNPLEMMGKVVGIGNALQQNQLTGQTLAMRQGLGENYANATDANGVTDFNKLIGTGAQDPRQAWNLGDIIAQAQANSKATSEAQMQKLNAGLQQTKTMNEFLGSLAADPALGKDHDAMVKKMGDVLTDYMNVPGSTMTSQKVAKLSAEFAGLNAPDQAQWIRNHANTGVALQGHLESILGGPQAVDTGAQTNIVRTPAMGGAPVIAGSLQNSTSPAVRATLVPTVIPETQADGTTAYVTRMVPRANLPGASGVGGGAAPVAQPAASGVPVTPQAAPAGAPQGKAAASPFPLAAAPPGVNEAETGVARDSAAALSADRAYAGAYTARNSQAVKALTALRSTNTGPGTEYRQGIVSTALAIPGLGTAGKALGLLDPKSIEAYDEANKLLAKNAADQLSATGAPSDARQSLIQTANASTHISNAAAQNIQIMNLGLDRMKSASVAAFDKTGLPSASYSKWLPTWMKTQDPRAYAVELMTPAERQELIGGIKNPAEKARFIQSGIDAVNLGFVPHSSTLQK